MMTATENAAQGREAREARETAGRQATLSDQDVRDLRDAIVRQTDAHAKVVDLVHSTSVALASLQVSVAELARQVHDDRDQRREIWRQLDEHRRNPAPEVRREVDEHIRECLSFRREVQNEFSSRRRRELWAVLAVCSLLLTIAGFLAADVWQNREARLRYIEEERSIVLPEK